MRRSERMQRRAFRRGYAAGKRLTDSQAARLENKLIAMIDAQKTFVLQVVATSLGQFRDELVDEANAIFVEMRKTTGRSAHRTAKDA